MPLLVILILAIALGVLLSRSRYSNDIDSAARQVSDTSRSWADRAGDWWQSYRPGAQTTLSFQEWATGGGAEYFPDDFKEWLADLSPTEAEKFTKSLSDYSKGLEYNLVELVEGSLNDRPSLLNVFVEAIVIYSQEYRKALKAHEESDETEDGADAAEEKKPAQKQASRRKSGSAGAAA